MWAKTMLTVSALGYPTCPQAHGHRNVLISSVSNAQLAVRVITPAPEVTSAPHSARMLISSGYGCDGDAYGGTDM